MAVRKLLFMRKLLTQLLKASGKNVDKFRAGDELASERFSEEIETRLAEVSDPLELGALLREVSLPITARATGVDADIDLQATSWAGVLNACKKACMRTGSELYILGEAGEWLNSEFLNKRGLPTVTDSGVIELAIVRDGMLLDRVSVNLWRKVAESWQCTSTRAPVKKTSSLDGFINVDQQLDAKIGPIDAVYTWVDSSDDEWQSLFSCYASAESMDPDRFSQSDELKFSIRSLFTYAPWVRKVFIVSNCAPPAWFKASSRLVWIRHDDVIPEKYLPLFNSHAIETFLHEVPDLSEQYVYFNDDMFLAGMVSPTDFFTPYGMSVSRLERSGVVTHLRELISSGGAEEWQHAAVNSANLLQSETGIFPTRLHRHVPYALHRSVYAEMVSRYPAEVYATRTARFRKNTDFSFTSFFYHHYAAWRRRAVLFDEESIVVRPSNFRRFIAQSLHTKHRFFCINDGGGSSICADYRAFKETFLQQRYPFKSPAET